MQRRRSKLEVSTFPFLAVLLCAMGALLLLLFIMDRRAKIASQNKASEAKALVKSRSKAEEDAIQADWEKAKEQLHLTLLEQQKAVLAEADGLEGDIAEAGKGLLVVQARHDELEKQIKGETIKIAEMQLQIASQRASLADADKKETMTKAELMKAGLELAELERAFLAMRALKVREMQTYSVVPYRGKRGDHRAPLYVECVGDGVTFHPEKKALVGWDFAPGSIRAEVSRRAGPLIPEKAVKDKDRPAADETKIPYVLFLVRPDGITSYYKAQAALRGFQLDFGYELIDQDWALDFAAETFAKNAPPVRETKPAITSRLNAGPGLAGIGPGGNGGVGPIAMNARDGNATGTPGFGGGTPFNGNPGRAPGGAPGLGFGGGAPFNGNPGGAPGGTPGLGLGGAGAPFNGNPGGAPGGTPGLGLGGGAPFNGNPGGAPGGTPGLGLSGGGAPFTGNPGGAPGGTPGGPGLTEKPGGAPPGTPGGVGPRDGSLTGNPGGASPGTPGLGNPGSSGGNLGPPPGAGTSSATPGLGLSVPNLNPGGGGPPSSVGGMDTGSPAKDPAFVPISKTGSSGRGGSPGGSMTPIASAGTPGSPSNPLNPNTSLMPRTDSVGYTSNPSGSGNGGTPNPNSNAADLSSANGGAGGAPEAGPNGGKPGASGAPGGTGWPNDGSGEPSPFAKPLPAAMNVGASQRPPPSAPVSPLSKVLGNKDFIITVDCYGDHVTVFPGGTPFRWTAANTQAVDQALMQFVSRLIERRQASVRPGEPPYRPLIRFQVSNEGLRTYYHAYPLLERLGAPMTRENVAE